MSAPGSGARKTEQIDLLRAKLHRPRVTRDLLVRPRLLDVLNDGLKLQITLVSAPAGFGKTTLISSWLDRLVAAGEKDPQLPAAAWLSLDEHDGDLAVFLSYLIAALRTVFPDAGSQTLALLRASQQPSMTKLFITLSNEIEALPRELVLVLDDYHLLTGRDVHQFLHDLMRHWPRPLHLVLISRVDPPLPLASLRARAKITEIRAAHLRFRTEETADYLDRALEMPLGAQDRALLERHTGGWIAALRLATLPLGSPIDVDRVSQILAQAGRTISDYLQDEILAQQVPAIQTFLLKTSVLERFNASLAEEIVGQVDPAWSTRACIDWIERADLLSAAPDEQGTWYRYHDLMRNFLKDRLLARFGAEAAADLHRSASAWFARQGLRHEAVRHAIECGDLDLAASLIEAKLRDELNRENRATMEHWLAALPEEIIERRPWLLMLKAWVLELSWQISRQVKVLSQLEELLAQRDGTRLPADEAQILRAQILALRGQEAYLCNQPARSVAFCTEALDLLPPSWTYVRGGAILFWGLGMAALGQDQEAERVLREEYESLDDKTDGYALRILLALCNLHLNAGRLESAGRTAQVMLQQAIRGDRMVPQGWAHLFLGLVAYQRNDLDGADTHLAEAVQRRYLSQSLCAHQSMAALVMVHQARGQNAEAQRVVDRLSSFQVEQRGHEEDEVHSLRAGLMFDQGNWEGAFQWADSFTAPVPDRVLFWADVPHITRARILLARNGPDDVRLALHILDKLLEISNRTHSTWAKIKILALRSLALDAQGQTGDARLALQEAIGLSQADGFAPVFRGLGPRMEALLGQVAAGSTQASMRRLLAALPGSRLAPVWDDAQAPPKNGNGSAPGSAALVEPLTAREFEILMLLQEPMSPKEIARRLDISYLTVKRHSINLYGKLGVNERWQAVNRAIELEILPPR